MKIIDKVITSQSTPRDKNVIWIDTSSGSPIEKHFTNGKWIAISGGGGGGTDNYEDLNHKPSINGVTLQGNKTTEQLGLTPDNLDTTNFKQTALAKSTDEVRTYDASEDTKLATEKFLQKTLKNIALPTQRNDATSKMYVDDTVADLAGRVMKFKGFISTEEPTGDLVNGLLWLNSAVLPSLFPINVKVYDSEAGEWSATFVEYRPDTLDLWSNLNNDKGYYWFGNGWNVLDEIFKTIDTTYAELKSLRDARTLEQGKFYRIRDYVATTTQNVTMAINELPFDIIVFAISRDKLAEDAWACERDGHTYLKKPNFGAWSLQYCLDNDTSRFMWADAANGKGVVYNLTDEWNNTVGFDFKNIGFDKDAFMALDTDNRIEGLMRFKLGFDGFEDATRFMLFSYQDDNGNIKDATVFAQELTYFDDIAYGVHGNYIAKCYNNGRQFIPLAVALSKKYYGTNAYLGARSMAMNGYNDPNSYYFAIGATDHCTAGFNSCRFVCYDASHWTCGYDCTDWLAEDGSWECGNDCKNWRSGDSSIEWRCGSFCSNWTVGMYCSSWVCHSRNSGWQVSDYISGFIILPNTCYEDTSLEFTPDLPNVTQVVGRRSDGTLRIWVLADEDPAIIDVNELPTSSIETNAIYRLLRYSYFNGADEISEPQGYRTTDASVLEVTADGIVLYNGGEPVMEASWAAMSDEMVEGFITDGSLEESDFDSADLYKLGAEVYHSKAGITREARYTLWHNPTATEAGYIEIGDHKCISFVHTFAGVEGETDVLYYLDTNYDEYTTGFYRYIEVEEAGVTVGKFVNVGNPKMQEVTYAKLKNMRDQGKLIPGMQYRITDFMTTTVQANTRSANHPFDIIVKADSESVLSEEAYAALHEGDTYFANNDLSAWNLKYCLDNDTIRFGWADATNGKGVVYYMRDEWQNECWYDFKNIQYKVASNTVAGLVNTLYYYTFTTNNSNSQGQVHDSTLRINCRDNRIGYYYADGVYKLPFNILRSTDSNLNCFSNVLGINCYNNYANAGFYLNVFGINCCNNSFGSGCYFLDFADGCSNNILRGRVRLVEFGLYCSGNDFGEEVIHVEFGKSCNNNVIGTKAIYVTFERYCVDNTIGQQSNMVSLSERCHGNNIGDNSFRVVLGVGCMSNDTVSGGKNLTVGSNVAYCNIVSGDSLARLNAVVLDSTKGTSSTSKLTIKFADNKRYTQYAGLKSDGKLRVWNIADVGDVEEKDNIIDVTELPTEDIDTQALYRLTTTHYYHNATELAEPPQGYKSLNEEALVADENGLTAIEGETSTTTPWADVTDAMIATLVSGSLVATCEFGEAGFFKTDADEYDYAGNFYTTDTYTLWHNATSEPTDWVEVDSVSNLVTDGETTEDVDGELQANAVIDVTALPTTGIKAKTLYRMLVHRYLEDGEPLSATPTGYVERGALAVVDENGITDTGVSPAVLYPWNEIDDDRMEWLIRKRLIREVAPAELMTESTCFKTAANHYVYKDHVTEEEVYELYHNPTATAGEFVKIGGGDASVETDNVTIQEVNGKLQSNAIIEVQTLPATGYKQNSLYRMLDTATQTFKRYYYNASTDPLPATPEFYKGDGEHVTFGAYNVTVNGSRTIYATLSEAQMLMWINSGWVSVTTDFAEAGAFKMPTSLVAYDSATKLTEDDYVVTAEMDKVFKRVQGGWECISYIQLDKEQYDILSEAQKNDGTLYIVNDEED